MKLILFFLAAIALVPSVGTDASAQTADPEVKAGIDAYCKADYAEALIHFQAATIESRNTEMTAYMAATLALQFIPTMDPHVSDIAARDEIARYKRLLDAESAEKEKFKVAMRIGYLYLYSRDFESSRTYYRLAVDIDPRNSEVQFAIGVVDWAACYAKRLAARSELRLDLKTNLSADIPEQKGICENLKGSSAARIEEGIDSMNRVLDSRPDASDPMVFLNLLHREKADIECDDPAARKRDLHKADEWIDKTITGKPVRQY